MQTGKEHKTQYMKTKRKRKWKWKWILSYRCDDDAMLLLPPVSLSPFFFSLLPLGCPGSEYKQGAHGWSRPAHGHPSPFTVDRSSNRGQWPSSLMHGSNCIYASSD